MNGRSEEGRRVRSITVGDDAAPEPALPQGTRPAGTANLIARAVREPLVHFLVAGLALFILYAMLQPQRFAPDASRRIELSKTDVARVEAAFAARWQRAPTETELRGLLASEIRNEILAREAVALGLDKNDVIIQRRLAQKMEFLAEDVSSLREPTSKELRDWFDRNKSEFASAPRVTFRHVFFSTDRRGAHAEAAAVAALASVSGHRNATPIGDAFMFQDRYSDRTAPQVAQEFGGDFATALFAAPVGRWSGPIASGLGWHLVWAEEVRPGEVPQYEVVEPQVRERWISDQRESAKRATFDAMLARYEVVMPDRPTATILESARKSK
jgi:peptidyl-prolyl cis-trans isomerase C